MSIYAKFLEIQRGVDRILKDSENKNDKYDYVSGSKVLSVLRPMMNDNALLLIPQVVDKSILEGQTRSGTARFTVELSLNMRWVDVENGETLDIPFYANGSDLGSAERAVGKALTYGEKYHLLKLFHIPTDKDDPDNDGRTKTGEPKQKGTPAEREKLAYMRVAIPAMLAEICEGDESRVKNAYLHYTKNDSRGFAGWDSLDKITDAALPVVYGKVTKAYVKQTGHEFVLSSEEAAE